LHPDNGLKDRETEFRGERLLERVREVWFVVQCVQKLWGVLWKAKFQYPLRNTK